MSIACVRRMYHWLPCSLYPISLTLQIRSGQGLLGLTSHSRSRLLYLDVRKTLLEVIKEIHVHFIDNLWLDTKLKLFKHSDKLLPINELDGIGAIPNCFPLGIHCKTPSGQQNALISLPNKGSSKIPDHACANRSLITLALK